MKIRKMLKSDRYINAASKKKKCCQEKHVVVLGFFPCFFSLFVLRNGRKKNQKAGTQILK